LAYARVHASRNPLVSSHRHASKAYPSQREKPWPYSQHASISSTRSDTVAQMHTEVVMKLVGGSFTAWITLHIIAAWQLSLLHDGQKKHFH